MDFAREHDLPLEVTAGGQDYGGNAVLGEGLLIDRSPMDAVRVDTDANIARVEPAATWADVDREAQADGLATTGLCRRRAAPASRSVPARAMSTGTD